MLLGTSYADSILIDHLRWHAPQLALLAACVFLALRGWRRHRRVSIIALVGVWLLLSDFLLGTWIVFELQYLEPDDRGASEFMGRVHRFRMIANVTQWLGLACLIAAAFVDRHQPIKR